MSFPFNITNPGFLIGGQLTTGEAEFVTELAALSPSDGDIFVYRAAGSAWTLEAKPVSSGTPAWGDITGTLSAQSDLQSALDGKQASDAFLTDIANLTDPNADRLLFWDDSAGDITWLTLGTNLSITGTTLNATGSGGLSNIVEDTTPQLGGNLDAQNNSIQNLSDVETDTVTADSSAGLILRNSGGTTVVTIGAGVGTGVTFAGGVNTGALGVTGNITVSGTVDGRDIAADGTLIDSAMQPGDNVSDLTNDAGYVTTSGYVPGGTDVALADGGTGASLTDPNADRIMFWDDSASTVTWLTVGSGLTITGTTITSTGGTGDLWSDPVDANIVPDGDNTRVIGSQTNRFSDAWIVDYRFIDEFVFSDQNGNTLLFGSSAGASAVNHFQIENSTTGNPVELQAVGSDTNISINLNPKGTGEAQVSGQRILDETDLASPTFTGTTATDLITYDAARGKVTAGGNLGATETINFNDETNYTGTLDSNITFTFSNATSGDEVTLFLSYDGTAQRTITWPSVTWLDNNNGSAPTTPAASGNVLVVTVRYIGTTYYASATGNYAVYS